ncbi:metallophosphoesterase [Corynebacterium halotolerans]|uniref:metallophosphoesterase n=1 Tax=Corynebacterium halotolerans TaxID=225326 RepID=UPI003CEC32B3
MSVWFTSDLHLGHRLVAGLRGFSGTARHDETVLENLAAALRPGDRLWVLGDLSVGDKTVEQRALDLLAEYLPGIEKHLIAGNHDSCHPLHKSAFRRQGVFLEVFESVQAYQKLRWQGREVWLSHFPRQGQDHEGMASRFDELRLEVPLLVHGHLHSAVPQVAEGQVDVGLDAWGLRPVRQEEVQDLLF